MPTFRITSPDGKTYDVTGPEGATADQALAQVQFQLKTNPEAPQDGGSFLGRTARDLAAGAVRGAGSIGATLLAPVDAAARALGVPENDFIGRTDRRESLDPALQSMGADPSSFAYGAGKLGAEVAGTLGVGGGLANGVRGIGAAVPALRTLTMPASNALASAGASLGGAGPTNMLARLALQAGGGAVTGAASAGLVDPSSTGAGAAIGGAFPIAGRVVGAGAEAAGALVRPFFASGQQRIAGDVLRQAAMDPQAARAALAAAPVLVPGSLPTTAAASGDTGLASLQRAMQNASPEFAANLSARQTAQNQARSAAVEGIAGNTGKIRIADDARDALTKPMRETVLDAAGNVPTDNIVAGFERLLNNPNNAGRLSQQALNDFQGQVAQFTQSGNINSRALYAIRKDINDVLEGRLQGERGNLKYAASQLRQVKGLIDDAIDLASRRSELGAFDSGLTAIENNPSILRLPSNNPLSTTVNAPGAASAGATSAGAGPRPSWRGYLETYAKESIPINQMKRLDEILKSVQTGSVDNQGGLILSAAKLNNLLKNQGDDLVRELSPEQLGILRNVQADLNAGQIVNNTGRAVGSNTVQNLAQNQLLQTALGSRLGGATPITSTLGRLLQLPYGTANRQIQERLGNSLLDPRLASRMLQEPQGNALLRLLEPAQSAGYRAAPVVIGQ